ncbi:MAG: dihydroorotase [Candidatus Anammoxibacter sp.]
MHEKALLIKNGRVIDPVSNTDRQLDILVEDNKIADLFDPTQQETFTETLPSNNDNICIIDARNKVVVPGLIDCHVHLREPGFENKETILAGTKAAAKGGFTSVICEPNTVPPIDAPEMVERLMRIARENSIVNFYTKACMTKGSIGIEVTDIESLSSKKQVIALSDDGNPVINDHVVDEIFRKAKNAGIVVTPHCEDSPHALDQKKRNETFSNPPYTNEANYIARDIASAEKTGAQLHISHVSLKESVNIIKKAKDRNLAKITCEVTPHHLILDNNFVDINGNKPEMNPPLRSNDDVMAMRERLSDGTIDVIASDHAPHTLQDKENGALGVIGLETTLGLIITEIVRKGVLSLNDVIKKMSCNPASIFGIKAGSLAVGMPADVTIIDMDAEWVVDSEIFESKSKNCPFCGWQLYGKTYATIVNGNLVMKDEEIC